MKLVNEIKLNLPLRAEHISDWTALGPARNGPDRFRVGPRAARTILGRLETSLHYRKFSNVKKPFS